MPARVVVRTFIARAGLALTRFDLWRAQMPLLQRHEWSSVHAERVHGLTLYCARRSRWGAPMTRWHWHPVEGGWHTRVESARAL
jgi:hypothetical protein